MKLFFKLSIAATSLVLGTFVAGDRVQAQAPQALIESCRQSVGRPIYQPCMRAGGTDESCKRLSSPKVRACVQAAMQKGGGGSPAMRGGPGGGGKQMAGPRTPAGPMLKKGRELMQARQFAAALVEFEKAVKADPKFPFTYAWRGTAKQRMGNSEAALPDFNEALELDPRNTLALTGRGYALYNSRDFGRALADLNRAIEVDPSIAVAFAYRGMVLTETGEADRAFSDLNKALKLDPTIIPVHNGFGGYYIRQKQFEKAIASFGKSLELDPRNFFAMNGRGFSYQSLGEPERALVDFNAALSLNPKFGRAYVNRGRIFMDKGDYAAAIRDSSEALKYFPKNAAALLQRARGYELSHDLAKAKEDFDAALAIAPTHPVAIAGLERLATKASGKDASGVRTGGRIALVIGNSKYGTFDTLTNPERDAKLLSDALSQSGFAKVQLVSDGTRDSMVAALKSFADEAKNAEWAVIYFAGHGIELDGNNYLVPVDAKYENDADIPTESVALDQVLNAVGGASQMRLVILDACRENPFAAERKSGETSNTGRGLARIEPETGTLVAFATKHGHLASDGNGANSPFAGALAQRIATPGLEINRLFRLVHDDVSTITEKKQVPFTYGQLTAQEFYFKAK